MTVADLIEALKAMPQDAEVRVDVGALARPVRFAEQWHDPQRNGPVVVLNIYPRMA